MCSTKSLLVDGLHGVHGRLHTPICVTRSGITNTSIVSCCITVRTSQATGAGKCSSLLLPRNAYISGRTVQRICHVHNSLGTGITDFFWHYGAPLLCTNTHCRANLSISPYGRKLSRGGFKHQDSLDH